MCNLASFASDLCLNEIENEGVAILIDLLIFAYTFGCLAIAADHLCNSLEILCSKWRLPEDIAGATFMALGSAMPEICVNSISTWKEEAEPNSARRLFAIGMYREILGGRRAGDDVAAENSARNGEALGVGAIIGSGFIALIVIPSLCSLWSPKGALVMDRRPLMRDMVTYIAGVTVLAHVLIMEQAHIWHCVTFLFIYWSYIVYMICTRYVWPPRRDVFDAGSICHRNLDARSVTPLVDLTQREDTNLLGRHRDSQGTSQTLESKSLEGGSQGSASPRSGKKDKENASEENDCDAKDVDLDSVGILFGKGRDSCISADLSDAISVSPVPADSFHARSPSAIKRRRIVELLCKMWAPIEWILDKTIPKNEKWYMLSVLASFIYIGIFSFLITDSANFIVTKISDTINTPDTDISTGNAILALCGLLFVSLGAEVPDAIQAITAAKRGHGSMAAASCLGSQVCNICVGCGLPWFIANVAGSKITFQGNDFLLVMSSVLVGAALTVFAGAMMISRCGSLREVKLGSKMAKSMLFSYGFYIVSLGTVCVILSTSASITK